MNLKSFVHSILCGLLITLASCQQERLSVIDQQEEENLTEDANLIMMIEGVTSHDGSHDNVVDNASCFSIDFPYQLRVNGELREITGTNDLALIYDYDEVTPVFPLNITFSDYSKTQVADADEMNALINGCSNGAFYNNSITCIDIIYPITIAEYNPATSDFQLMVYDHDRMTFTGLRRMVGESAIGQLQYPIQLQVVGGETLQIGSNEQLKAVISSNLDFCF